MALENLGETLGDVVSSLEEAAMDLDSSIDRIMDVDGMTIVDGDDAEAAAGGESVMTTEELYAFIAESLSGLDSAQALLDEARGMLESVEEDLGSELVAADAED